MTTAGVPAARASATVCRSFRSASAARTSRRHDKPQLVHSVTAVREKRAVEFQGGGEGTHVCQMAIVVGPDDMQLPITEAMLNSAPCAQQRRHALNGMDTSKKKQLTTAARRTSLSKAARRYHLGECKPAERIRVCECPGIRLLTGGVKACRRRVRRDLEVGARKVSS